MELLGRDREVADVVERLQRRRLVTVIGLGGIGKTSVARVAAARAGDAFAHGTHFVDLTRVDAPDDVAGALAAQLGYPSFGALLGTWGEQPALLVVDHCEHVIAAAARAILELLDACPTPTVLATSRSPLDVPGESLVALGPLGMPAPGGRDATRRVRGGPALRLFLDRACDAGAELRGSEFDAMVELCRRLDGVPLAIEIAAAQCRVETPTQILEHLTANAAGDRSGARGAGRHPGVRATIAWSYALLAPELQHLFDRLGIFAGAFTASMAHGLIDPRDDIRPPFDEDAYRTATCLESLVASALLLVDHHGPETWYRMPETVRRCALDQLRERGLLHETWERFVDHVVAQVTAIPSRGDQHPEPGARAQLLARFDDMTATLRWLLDHDERADRALRIVAALGAIVHHARAGDLLGIGDAVLSRWCDTRTPYWADAAATVAACRHLTGRPDAALQLADHALSTASDSLLADISLHRVMGEARRALGDPLGAATHFEQGAKEARARSAYTAAIELDVARAIALTDAGTSVDALALVREAHREAEERSATAVEVWAASVEAHLRLHTDAAGALPVIERALDAARRIHHDAAIAVAVRARVLALVTVDRLDDAAVETLELLDRLVERGALDELRTALDTAAIVLARAGRRGWADLAATARALPIVNLSPSVDHERFPLPPGDGTILEPRDAIRVARRQLRDFIDAVPPATATASTAEAAFVWAGDLWELRFGGKVAYLKASKGAADLARLLAAPHREIQCPDASDSSAMTQRLRATIRRIEDAHPQLARHLERSITTGGACCYRPEHDITWHT